jgi:ATP-dependent DNA helicase RecG
MFLAQRKRYFPLPDYELKVGEVEMRLYGKVIDLEYTRLLARNEELSLPDVMLLDRVQKEKKITSDQAKRLKAIGCLEGRRPNYYLSASVADLMDTQVDYIRQRGLDDSFFKELILSFLKEYEKASRRDIDNLLINKLPDVLSEEQKKNRIKTLLAALKKKGDIYNAGNRRNSEWRLVKE